MKSYELKTKFLDFFRIKGHKRIKNSSLIPENDSSALFINSGMHPIVNYLMGEKHPLGTRLMNYQRALRTGDIENVGLTKRHHTFFEMLGEWSLGDYWKRESLNWSVEFIVNILGLDPKRLYATVFKGDYKIPQDKESIEIWIDIFKKFNLEPTIGENFALENCPRIVLLGRDDNFWPKGKVIGPCGPCSEIYYDLGVGEDIDSRFLEICNNVFMEYYQDKDGNFTYLNQKNVDVGWGYERILSIIQNLNKDGSVDNNISNFETDLFDREKIILFHGLNLNEDNYYKDRLTRRDIRAILDHIRASVMLIGDGVVPSNKDQGYILRRLIRRAVTFAWKYESINASNVLNDVAISFINKLSLDEEYLFLSEKKDYILNILSIEINKFVQLLKDGINFLKIFNSDVVDANIAFKLKESKGIPIEIVEEIAHMYNKKVDLKGIDDLIEHHKKISRASLDKKFEGGLGEYTFEAICYHTCAHLFLAGARQIIGDFVVQKGQNITSQRLRYDFYYPYDSKVPEDKIIAIEEWVNNRLIDDLLVDYLEVPYQEAKKYGVIGMFDEKYKDLKVTKIYRIYKEGSLMYPNILHLLDKDKYISLEFCGGPHVSRTSEILKLGKFKILKQENLGNSIKRIKAILAN